MNNVVTLKDIEIAFGDKNVLNGLNLEIKTGTIFGLLGHNGAGKTTTFRIIKGLYVPQNGEVKVFGKHLADFKMDHLSKIGYLGEDTGLYENLTVRDNLVYYGKLFNVSNSVIDENIQKYVSYFQLENDVNTLVSKLSRGMKKKVALIRTLIHNPELIIMDEPLNDLDPVAAKNLCDLFYQLKNDGNVTIIINSHHLEEIEQIVDDYAIIKNGVAVAVDVKQELKYKIKVKEVSDEMLLEINNKYDDSGVFLEYDDANSSIELIVQSEEQLNDILQILLANGISIQGVEKCSSSLKEVYLQNG